MQPPEIPAPIAEVFAGWPAPGRDALLHLRALIYETAATTGTGPLSESLEWRQPSYVPRTPRIGTALRLGYAEGEARPVHIFVHCGTDLVTRYRQLFEPELAFAGNRAITLPETSQSWPEAALRQAMAMALSYHRDKSQLEKAQAHG